jgi:hypothetical protein
MVDSLVFTSTNTFTDSIMLAQKIQAGTVCRMADKDVEARQRRQTMARCTRRVLTNLIVQLLNRSLHIGNGHNLLLLVGSWSIKNDCLPRVLSFRNRHKKAIMSSAKQFTTRG